MAANPVRRGGSGLVECALGAALLVVVIGSILGVLVHSTRGVARDRIRQDAEHLLFNLMEVLIAQDEDMGRLLPAGKTVRDLHHVQEIAGLLPDPDGRASFVSRCLLETEPGPPVLRIDVSWNSANGIQGSLRLERVLGGHR